MEKIKTKPDCYTCRIRYMVENQDYCERFKQGIPEEILSGDFDCDIYKPYIQNSGSGDNE